MGEIARREREISGITDRLLSAKPDSIRSKIDSLKATAVSRIRDLRTYLNTDRQMAREYLARHVEAIVMEPDGKAYVASGSWNLLGRHSGGAEGQNRTAYAGLFRAALYR
jgi:hypothetical protein